MIKAAPLTDKEKDIFSALFKCYYAELGCVDDAQTLVDDYILPDLLAGLLHIEMLSDGNYIGFVIYQIDDITNDWNLKEGWGNIREIYIAPHSRKKGYGKFLLYTAEMKLKESGAKKTYCLPYEEAIPFFTACGYENTQEYNDELDCCVHAKSSLDNCCK